MSPEYPIRLYGGVFYRLIRDCSWGNIIEKIESVAAKFGSICLKVNPKFTSQKCSHCGHIQKENRNKERFLCLNCGFFADADIQASVNIGVKGVNYPRQIEDYGVGFLPNRQLSAPLNSADNTASGFSRRTAKNPWN